MYKKEIYRKPAEISESMRQFLARVRQDVAQIRQKSIDLLSLFSQGVVS
ncbi:hypothetical protein [Flavilitoribacter nigricans]|nr:hypothetical protein [Flavilitoribacter nigricans]